MVIRTSLAKTKGKHTVFLTGNLLVGRYKDEKRELLDFSLIQQKGQVKPLSRFAPLDSKLRGVSSSLLIFFLANTKKNIYLLPREGLGALRREHNNLFLATQSDVGPPLSVGFALQTNVRWRPLDGRPSSSSNLNGFNPHRRRGGREKLGAIYCLSVHAQAKQ